MELISFVSRLYYLTNLRQLHSFLLDVLDGSSVYTKRYAPPP